MSEPKPSNPKDAMGVQKAPMSCISASVLRECGLAMAEGALKYGRFNYRVVGVRATVYYDAALRHLMSWFEGEDIDPDSGISHLTKAMVSLAVLRDAMIQGKMEDDRPPASAMAPADLDAQMKLLLEKYGDRRPRHYTIADTMFEPFSTMADEARAAVEKRETYPLIDNFYDLKAWNVASWEIGKKCGISAIARQAGYEHLGIVYLHTADRVFKFAILDDNYYSFQGVEPLMEPSDG